MKYIIDSIKEKQLLVLIALSSVIRAYVWFATPIIGTDGISFISIAKSFSAGNFREGLEHPYHPFYSILISIGSLTGIGFESSGKLVSLISGVLMVAVVYMIGKRMFNQTIGFIAALILTLHPFATRLSADVMSDSTYYFFYMTALSLGFAAVTQKKMSLHFYTGVAAGFAYLTRPEGISPVLITGLYTSLQLTKTIFTRLKGKFQNSQKEHSSEDCGCKQLTTISMLVLGFFIISFPYILYIKQETGKWTITKKKNVTEISGLSIVLDKAAEGIEGIEEDVIVEQGPEPRRKYINAIYKIIAQYFAALHYPLIIFLIIGIIYRIKGNSGSPNQYLLSYVLLFSAILFFLKIHSGYASYRHLMNISLVTLFWVAMGVHQSYYWLNSKFKSSTDFIKNEKRADILTSRNGIIILCVLCALLLPKTLKSHREEKVVRKTAGMWLKDHHKGTTPLILTDKRIIAYYADADSIKLPFDFSSYTDILNYSHAVKADYLAVSDSIKKQCVTFFENVNSNDLQKLNEFRDRKRSVTIYKITDW